MIAKLLGRGSQTDSYTKKVDDWVASTGIAPPQELRTKAVQALNRIVADDSELAELWLESGDGAWLESVKLLRSAMST